MQNFKLLALCGFDLLGGIPTTFCTPTTHPL